MLEKLMQGLLTKIGGGNTPRPKGNPLIEGFLNGAGQDMESGRHFEEFVYSNSMLNYLLNHAEQTTNNPDSYFYQKPINFSKPQSRRFGL